ncbi:AAA family ATPase [Methylobacter svalbardensis]|uniref:AAA family ATPase n=1 Tax=Methylobacter svalbardensis TaxID=3080016 RepID=UPI0030EC9549
MERIEINGFLTIDHADFEIRKINILIGAQAQGKSVIAKLVYFFKKNFSDAFYQSIQKFATKREIDKKCLAQFEQIFPRYSWVNQEFSIVYKNGDVEASIIRTKAGNKYTLKFNYCKDLADFHKELKNSYKLALDRFSAEIEQEINKKTPTRREFIFHDTVSEKIDNSTFSNMFKESIFIPAGRSFFATLQKNVFSFLVNDIDIDTFIKEFGSRLEQMKRFHEIDQIGFLRHDKANDAFRKKIDKLINDIVVGEYVYAEEQDWVLNEGKRTNLANASSGQQESLPMLLILKIWPLVFGNKISFFIEEPEAHLFPVSQKQIISLIATIYNTFGHSFFITTHSPYILTAINNLVVGQDACNKANGDKNKLKKLAKVLPTDELIRLEDVSAYTLNKGKLESIIDMENRLIGANLLDAVSDEFDAAFSVATEILYGAE